MYIPSLYLLWSYRENKRIIIVCAAVMKLYWKFLYLMKGQSFVGNGHTGNFARAVDKHIHWEKIEYAQAAQNTEMRNTV